MIPFFLFFLSIHPLPLFSIWHDIENSQVGHTSKSNEKKSRELL